MAKYDVNPQRASLLGDATTLACLPPELLHVIRDQSPASFLDAISQAALNPRLTGRIFAHFEPLFADICARWVLNTTHRSCNDSLLAAFAMILPFAPQLSVFLDDYLQSSTSESKSHSPSPSPSQAQLTARLDLTEASNSVTGDAFLQKLLAVWRLLNFDREAYASLVLPSQVQDLFSHSYGPIRYLAIRIFCVLLSVSDLKLEALVRHHIPEGETLNGDFDGKPIDYTFLSLFERTRAEDIHKHVLAIRGQVQDVSAVQIQPQNLTTLVVHYGNTVLPRPRGPPGRPSSLVATPTTLRNLEYLSKLLQQPGPVLLHGSSGAGKTALVQELARELDMDSSLVTLHLNEQTDAKMLIGLYTTGTKPGSFEWRPGILTTAVREGRWVLIEDLDRAPTEVMSTLLPLIERGELLIPNRGERIQAPSSFRILATVRTSRGMNGQENLPVLLGLRFWKLLAVQGMPLDELQVVIHEKYPLLHRFVADPILTVFDRVCLLLTGPALVSGASSASERPISSRDLFKWCRRMEKIIAATGARTGREPMSETVYDGMFMEAIDCFASGIKDSRVREKLILHIGEMMGRSSQRVEHHLTMHTPRLEETETHLTVGRSRLQKTKRLNRVAKSKRPFAPTTHARRLLEQIAIAVDLKEPVLLVGETGIGKTTVVQQLAESLGHRLIAVNLSQQSEVGDLLGGFKPINVRNLAVPLKEEFEDLFASTGISQQKNQKYLDTIGKNIAKGKWTNVAKLWKQAPQIFAEILKNKIAEDQNRDKTRDDGQPAKRRKTESSLQALLELKPRWEKFSKNLEQFEIQLSGGGGGFAFAFVEGNIVKAVRNGDWVLLDEINLASPDTLESIADLLQSGPDATPSILLSETGEIERVQSHPNFRIFGAMNPATDVGKRDLPLGLRSRFTELYVASPDKDFKDLVVIVKSYLSGHNSRVDQAADKVASLYMRIKELAEAKALVDGANEVPHFSLRTLTRVLSYVNDVAPFYGLERSLYEGFCMGFLTLLSRDSEKLVMPLITEYLFGKEPSRILAKPPKYPNDGREYVKFTDTDNHRIYWLLKGVQPPKERTDYIRTPYVERNLLNLVRATSTRRFPVLIQGPTSSGKTSMIEYLAEYSGNKFVRINNHEHTDLQEYLGTYVSGSDGKLKFQEGLLVQAMRQGHWIVLDELNLAPTDILEALNRLLDDNRELLIPETQEIVRPHENFMLFATQNPPGLYGGRKVLSRAFRNRFLELHYDDIPEDELEYILQKRSVNTAPSDCRRIVSVYKELSRLRQTSRVFEQKDSFATLRDLFRWALRDAETREDIANNGFMLLAERVRNDEERIAVREVIETVFKVKIDPDQLYGDNFSRAMRRDGLKDNRQGIVWTNAMRRLYILVSQALRNNEPVLLVGETGCGKTTICQLLAEAVGKELHIVNAHQNTETGDLIGSQRPVRNRGVIAEALKQSLTQAFEQLNQPAEGNIEDLLARYHGISDDDLGHLPESLKESIHTSEVRSKALFEWSDGSLVHAMKSAHFFLLDEISLADDSVLERLNSVLEPGRTLLLAEKGTDDSFVQAADGFQFFATMNPGGDFGKKELSPALRNRFTEIWVPPLSSRQDILDIVVDKLKPQVKPFAHIIVDFSYWFGRTCRSSTATAFSIRDILVWVNFVNHSDQLQPALALLHGAATVFIDTLGANPSALLALDPKTMDEQRQNCLGKLNELIGNGIDVTPVYRNEPQLVIGHDTVQIGDFSVARVPGGEDDSSFAFDAPTTKMNLMRVIRALSVNKPILLEGNPGVGKTTLVSALAKACGRPLTRINLSDQTDLMDLFGTDVPVEGAEAGNFAWRDAPFLQAMQKGEWVLLDEMNLASQSVLEGLNACLDHRGEIYISELDQVFKCHPDFKLFAAQNPHSQGGGRKGLPSSFVNRFIVVYADVFTEEDLILIAGKRYTNVPSETIQKMVRFVSNLDYETSMRKSFGSHGSPWEFNLRDSLRWLELLASKDSLLASAKASDFLDIIITQRFRSAVDRQHIARLFTETFEAPPQPHSLYHNLSSAICQVGLAMLERNPLLQPDRFPSIDAVPRLSEIESLLICVKQNLPCILVGPSGSGKSSLLSHVAASVGKALVTFPLNADVDAMDLVGGFEQADPLRELHASLESLREVLLEFTLSKLPQVPSQTSVNLIGLLENHQTEDDLARIMTDIRLLASEVPAGTALGQELSHAFDLLHAPRTLANPRFEWLDGVIVRAMEMGRWLVLDNANLCSASVLDRLNSLLERPDGFLSINEHSGPDGEPRIIKPHPDFRIFLTMDPRYGELSRAMRNRSVEIYLEPVQMRPDSYLSRITDVESALRRYAHATRLAQGSTANGMVEVATLALDNLSLGDTSILSKYEEASSKLLPLHVADPSQVKDSLSALASYLSSPMAAMTRQAVLQFYSSLSQELSQDQALITILPLHTLHNSPMASLADKLGHISAEWLSICYEFFLESQHTEQAMQSQARTVDRTKSSSLNRLQRSLVSGTVATVAKDSTVNVAGFLNTIVQLVRGYIESTLTSSDFNITTKSILRALLHYWWRTFTFVTGTSFEEARFQAHLKQGVDLLQAMVAYSRGGHTLQMINSTLSSIQDAFTVGFKLSTGLSMEILWQLLRPTPIVDEATFSAVQEMEKLASRFDAIRWKSNANIGDLSKGISSLSAAYSIVRGNAAAAGDLIHALQGEIQDLEANVDESRELSPFFEEQFETLRQSLVIQRVSRKSAAFLDLQDVVVLSNVPTLSQMRLQGMDSSHRLLHSLDYILGRAATAHPWSGRLISSLLDKYDSTASASLFSLQSLETEYPAMGKLLAGSSEAVSADSVGCLNQLLWHLMRDIFEPLSLLQDFVTLYERLSRDLGPVRVTDKGLVFDIQLPNSFQHEFPQHLHLIVDQHYMPAVIALVASEKSTTQKSGLSAIAWAHFAIGCIKLYVPDKIFDPYLRAQTERDYHEELLTALKRKWQALCTFESTFTGQSSSLRSELLRQEIEDLGDPPTAATTIYRPVSADLNRLQGEFNNILSAVVKTDVLSTLYRYIASPSGSGAQEVQLVQDNIIHLVERLTSRFPAYEDLTTPLLPILRSLQVGLSLSTVSGPLDKSGPSPAWLFSVTPLLGGSLFNPETAVSSQNLEFLSYVGLLVSIDGFEILDSFLREKLVQSLHYFYEEWSKKLDADKRQDAIKSSLYRYRGGIEDEEEADQHDFNELFPDYETEVSVSTTEDSGHSSRNLSMRLADRHENIFLGSQDSQDSIISFCKTVGRKISRETTTSGNLDAGRDRALLPAALLVLDEKLDSFNSSTASSSYNFYNSSNIFEARKLVNLVHSIRLRFKELQSIDEIAHLQPLGDVLSACDHVLELSHTDPLAKIIHRVEKLHAFVYEWQFGGWASHIHGALALYNKVTEILVSWRRLELATWAKLFDQEVEKCHSDAKAWWFVAYHAVIAIPMTKMELGHDLKDYTIQLMNDLEMFFSEAVLGEFHSRLQLLRQLSKQLELLVLDYKEVAVIHNAVLNFLSMYRRYDGKVTGAIQKGRASIEKNMKDVLLLASWKDTNIAALRESARKSHQKLFKLVRKFRAILGQPMKSIVDQGLPDEQYVSQSAAAKAEIILPKADDGAAAVCQQLLPGWLDDAHTKRLSNADKIISIMAKASQLPESTILAADIIDTFVSETMSSMAALGKETPAFLTDENKVQVKHLKSRKVRLFDETVKLIRTMGFNRNLNETYLRNQKQLAAVLAKVNHLPCEGVSNIAAESEYYFYKVLDLAPRIRNALHDHHGDLTNEVVRRSTGYMEGMLYVLIQQRHCLADNSRQLGCLEAALSNVQALTASGQAQTLAPKRTKSNHPQVLRWLVSVLRFGLHLLDVHAKLGKLDNSIVQAALREWLAGFSKLQSRFESVQNFHDGFEFSAQFQLREEMEDQLASFEAALQLLESERPDLAFIFQQLQLWTAVTVMDDDQSVLNESVHLFFEDTLTLSKKVLDAMQKFQKAVASMPTSAEEASWLLQYNDTLANSAKSLHIDTIVDGIQGAMSRLSSVKLDDPALRNAAFSLLAVTLPVLQQFANTCRKTVADVADLHRASAKMTLHLGKAFVEIASRGFCTPQEKSDETSGDQGNLESGTGLGDGEGAEDISKDIQPDEDLSELAQEPNKEKEGDIEDQEDAIDMGQEEMEGEMGSVAGEDDDEEGDKKDGDEEEEDDDMDEEAGDVDDLDPTAVDEKMWDGDGDDADKDQKGDQAKGQKKEDEQVAADENSDSKDIQPQDEPEQANPEPEEEAGPEQDDSAAQEELNRQDQNVDENEALALPDDMDIDGNDDDNESAISDDELDRLSDVQPEEIEEEAKEEGEAQNVDEGDGEAGEMNQEDMEQEIDSDNPDEDMQGENAEMEEQEPEPEEQGAEEGEKDEDKQPLNPDDEAHADPDNAAPSDVRSGAGQDQNNMDGQDDQNSQSKAAQREHGEMGQNAEDQETAAGNEGATSRQDEDQNLSDEANKEGDSSHTQPFKKLGDALERWYRNHQDIKEAMDEQETRQNSDADMAQKEFQHLQNDDDAPDAQALGAAAEDEVQPIDESMAIDQETKDEQSHVMPQQDDESKMDTDGDGDESEHDESKDQEMPDRDESRTGVATRRGAFDKERSESPTRAMEMEQEEQIVEETSTQLSTTHISDEDRPLRDYTSSLASWTNFQTKTHPLSLALTSQLRLILTPSQSTKLSGSYRTGKRLNIKKIIPYIASSYKRDKIWMRRAIPTKRTYQILLCVDDSRSMGETTSGTMALESLVMVSRALAMLEVGQVGVLGFGADVFAAHDLTAPLLNSHDAGAKVMQKFTFEQDRTDICQLIRQTIDQFRTARNTNRSGAGEDLWQLALILSDGLTPSSSHERIRRLLREALEERIMVVFIIMDDSGAKKGDSVLELKEAKFVKEADGNSRVVIERYLDTFPFQYYLIVHNLEDLPGALAGLLRTWFAEVNS